MVALTGRDRADVLVAAYGRQVGADSLKLDAHGDVSFGSTGFHFDPMREVLIGRVFINRAHVANAQPDEIINYRRMAATLNDPAVGGMFERGGGVFVLDEGRQAYFLARAFPVTAMNPQALISAMERLQEIAAAWTIRWFYHVALIMHGHERPPTNPITLANEEG